MGNESSLHEFLFMGFAHLAGYENVLFVGFLVIYFITVTGNIVILSLIWVDIRLHTPMYFFLSNLSALDLCYASSTTPQILQNLLMDRKGISFQACMAQLFFLISCAGAECILLAVMSYDRYVAICIPLHYPAIMIRRTCLQLAACPWLIGILNATLHTIMTSVLPFCGPNTIQHFFCDVPQLLKISCIDTSLNDAVLHVVTIFVGFGPFFFIILSYVRIISSILKIRSVDGRWKAFSTCGAHLTVVTLYYSTIIFNYNRPPGGYPKHVDTLASVLFCIVTPMLNPMLYTLRNKDVVQALKRAFSGHSQSRCP
ncbi:olfactory receptor 5V1-like [Ambystoma mexicanum]|uniref:olfactory receptor 5V1-like n=1 Tax=Ambystoma mexicanum TaxID=8296 RepID=UPI0037E70C92